MGISVLYMWVLFKVRLWQWQLVALVDAVNG